jgi:hypothetical protein
MAVLAESNVASRIPAQDLSRVRSLTARSSLISVHPPVTRVRDQSPLWRRDCGSPVDSDTEEVGSFKSIQARQLLVMESRAAGVVRRCESRRQAKVGQAGRQALDLHRETAMGLPGRPVEAEPAQQRQLAPHHMSLDAVVGVAELA